MRFREKKRNNLETHSISKSREATTYGNANGRKSLTFIIEYKNMKPTS